MPKALSRPLRLFAMLSSVLEHHSFLSSTGLKVLPAGRLFNVPANLAYWDKSRGLI